jgi:hypothetical protein
MYETLEQKIERIRLEREKKAQKLAKKRQKILDYYKNYMDVQDENLRRELVEFNK